MKLSVTLTRRCLAEAHDAADALGSVTSSKTYAPPGGRDQRGARGSPVSSPCGRGIRECLTDGWAVEKVEPLRAWDPRSLNVTRCYICRRAPAGVGSALTKDSDSERSVNVEPRWAWSERPSNGRTFCPTLSRLPS